MIRKNVQSQKWLSLETGNLIQQVTTDVDAQIDFAVYALSLYAPFPNMVNLSRATPSQKERFFKLVETYCANNLVDYSVFKDEDLKQRFRSIQIETLRNRIGLIPNKALSYFYLADLYRKEGMLDEAAACYSELLQIEPDNTRALNNMGNALKSQSKLDEAIGYYRQSLRITPNSASTHYNLGDALKLKGRLGEAVGHYRQVLRFKPDHANAHSSLGYVLALQGRLTEAVKHFTKALRIKPDLADAHYNLGGAFAQQGNLDEAVSRYRQTLQFKPDFAEAHHSLGLAFQLKGKLNEAVNHYRQALQLKPDLAEAHNNLGSVLIATGRFDEALEHFREAVRLKPDYLMSLNGMAGILATHPDPKVRDVAEAIVLAERAAELTHYKDIAILDTLEVAYAAAGQFDRAITTAQTAIALASAAQDAELVKQIRKRVELYKQSKP
jgi:tetratricopeptide (TPR) repeat protein